ncbi:MAG: lytic transglycosylase domain-containing protein, partial [Thermoleophilia bacterium]|nr:lytic transglycosylase domain-containing protein [Thermoleophilia bacterium]
MDKSVAKCFILGLSLAIGAAWAEAPDLRMANVEGRLKIAVDPQTGKLVRRVEPSEAVKEAAEWRRRLGLDQLIEQTARRHGVDPLLVHAIISVESNYNPFAVSEDGAQGLMQLLPGTARRLGVRNVFDPGENLEAGVRYLKGLLDRFGHVELALAAYNAGSGVVEKLGRIPSYPETKKYVAMIGQRYARLKRAAGGDKRT